MVPGVGIEPTRPEGHGILSPERLPVPPPRPGELSHVAPTTYVTIRLRRRLRCGASAGLGEPASSRSLRHRMRPVVLQRQAGFRVSPNVLYSCSTARQGSSVRRTGSARRGTGEHRYTLRRCGRQALALALTNCPPSSVRAGWGKSTVPATHDWTAPLRSRSSRPSSPTVSTVKRVRSRL